VSNARRRDQNITIEDARIAFRNFAGVEDKFNAAGNRNFVILLDPSRAQAMTRDGWNVKYLKPRSDEDEPQPYVEVTVSYKARPPKIIQVTSRGKTYLTEDLVETLDWVDIEVADITLNPYDWEVNGMTGRKAYLSTLVVKILEDYLEMKWDAIIEQMQNDRRALESGKDDYIEGEYYESRGEIGA
jgi:hypothetical protein